MRALPYALGVSLAAIVIAPACSSSSGGSGFGGGNDGGTGGDSPHMLGGDTGGFGGETGGHPTGDPQTCADALASHSYIGCDYWPTPVANNVWSVFDFAVVAANATMSDATVTVTGPNAFSTMSTVPAGQLAKIYLPWVPALKGPDADVCGSAMALPGSVLAMQSAYHLVSSVPVTVYQFNAIEYQGMGGAAGKDWSTCPGLQPCILNNNMPVGCFSFTNDASLLLPSTAMTGNYRVTGEHGWGAAMLGGYFAVTGTQNNTNVTVKVSQTGTVLGGGSIPSTSPGNTITFMLNAGDVAEIVGYPMDASDLSGSLVTASNPVEVISGVPCIQNPLGTQACDHMEQSVFPAETLGKHYIVTVPTSPHAAVVGHVVRFYGNVDGTTLTYAPSNIAGCPSMINAGQVAECTGGGQPYVMQDFEVTGNHEFGVGTFMLGGALQDPASPVTKQEGDPSESMFASVEQFRTKYIFLAPDDYTESYADIVAPAGTTLTLDGASVGAQITMVGTGGFGIARVLLGPGQSGAHVLTATNPVGLQVMGYGLYTSYQYPGGLNLAPIAPPPVK
jgi:hypothetical protein